ncbi:hypothetical protein Tco_0690227, partial [Tanacetum coccineum]
VKVQGKLHHLTLRPQTVPETINKPDHSHDHESTPPRPTTNTSSAPVHEQGPSSDPNIASSSRPHESAPDLFTSTNVEDETMGALSSLVSTLVQKVNTQGGSRKAGSKEDAEPDADPLIKLAKAAASAVPTGGSHEADILPSSSIPSDEFAGGSDVPASATTGPSVDPSNKGKSPLLEEDPPVRERTFRQREEDRLDSDWTNIMGQVHANQGLTADLLGPDVNEDNFAERMVALIAKRRRDFAAQRAAVAELKSLNIKRSLKRPGADLEQASSKKSKPTEAPKSSVPDESQQPSAEVPPTATQQPSEFSSQPTVPSAEPRTHSYGTRRKSLGARKKSSTELDLTADDRSFIRVLSDDSDDSDDDDDPPIFWPAFAAWEVVPTGLGDVNALYFMDKSSKYFTHLREILHLVDRKDLFKLYGMVVQYYEEHPLAGSGMILWGDLQVLFESHEGGTGAGVWADQQQWVIRSWRLFPFSGVHVLETISGKILYMFADTPYPLSAQLMKKMLKHKLEVEIDGIGNDMTYAEQLIQFIKNQSFGFHLSFVKLVVNGFCFLENLGFWYTLLGLDHLVFFSHSTIPIEDGDPEAEHKICIKYASDEDSASDDDIPINLYDVVDWELLPTGLVLINVFYRTDNSRKYFTSLREILHLVTRADLMT